MKTLIQGSIEIEFLVGTDIPVAVRQAAELAGRLGILYVCFNLNDVSVSVQESAYYMSEKDINDALSKAYKMEHKIMVLK